MTQIKYLFGYLMKLSGLWGELCWRLKGSAHHCPNPESHEVTGELLNGRKRVLGCLGSSQQLTKQDVNEMLMRYYLDVSLLFSGQICDHQQQIKVNIVARVSGRASVRYWEINVLPQHLNPPQQRRIISILPRSLIWFYLIVGFALFTLPHICSLL